MVGSKQRNTGFYEKQGFEIYGNQLMMYNEKLKKTDQQGNNYNSNKK